MKGSNTDSKSSMKRTAFSFILLMGIVSLFSDMTHEGAASILGNFLSLAGASATTIGSLTLSMVWEVA